MSIPNAKTYHYQRHEPEKTTKSPIPKSYLPEKTSVGFEIIQSLASQLMTAENKKLCDGVLGKLSLHFTSSGWSNLCLSLFN
jgi:hypothetical protein